MIWQNNEEIRIGVQAALKQSNMNIKQMLETMGAERTKRTHYLLQKAIVCLRKRGIVERVSIGAAHWAIYRLVGQ